jgi:hypothetical protein
VEAEKGAKGLDASDTEPALKFFNKWFGNHKTTCGVGRLEVEMEREDAGVIHVKLVCPACSRSITGLLRDVDVPRLNSLLGPEGLN